MTLRPPQVRGQLETSALRSEHVFYPGSAWLYLKLYHGPGLGSEAATRTFLDEDLLARFIAPLIAELEATQQLADFHFVRYADPEAHLRLRLRPAGQTALQLLFDRLAPRLQQQGDARAFARYTLDTYEREVDRYGGSALIASAERLFTADSRLCLRLLTAAHRDRIETETDQHMLLPIYTPHTLLSGFGLTCRPASERCRGSGSAGSHPSACALSKRPSSIPPTVATPASCKSLCDITKPSRCPPSDSTSTARSAGGLCRVSVGDCRGRVRLSAS